MGRRASLHGRPGLGVAQGEREPPLPNRDYNVRKWPLEATLMRVNFQGVPRE